MNKGGLVAEVAKRTGVSKAEVARVVDASIDVVRETVVDGERVTLADFGTFERKHRNERIARNPRKPDVPIVVPARDLPSFTRARSSAGRCCRLGVATPSERHEVQVARHLPAAPVSTSNRTRCPIRRNRAGGSPNERSSIAISARSSVSSDPVRVFVS